MFRFLIFFVATAALAHGAPSDTLGSSRIIGGVNAAEGQYPYQVSLKLYGTAHNCGGCFITNRTVLTAANCLYGRKPDDFKVFAGSVKLDGPGKLFDVEKLIQHKIIPNDWTDIGLVILKEEVEFDELITNIELGETYIEGGTRVTLTGWGYAGAPSGLYPNNLQTINLKAITNAECLEETSGVVPSEMCTFTKAGEGFCERDWGSPLVAGRKVVGIVSRGISCAIGKPDVYTRVSSYIGWINENKV